VIRHYLSLPLAIFHGSFVSGQLQDRVSAIGRFKRNPGHHLVSTHRHLGRHFHGDRHQQPCRNYVRSHLHRIVHRRHRRVPYGDGGQGSLFCRLDRRLQLFFHHLQSDHELQSVGHRHLQGLATVNVLNHIIFMAQENRGLDHYFGSLRAYWRNNGYDRSFLRWPPAIQSHLRPHSALRTRRQPIPAAIPHFLFRRRVIAPSTAPVQKSLLITSSRSASRTPALPGTKATWTGTVSIRTRQPPRSMAMSGTTAHDSRNISPPYNDTNGIRDMGYYNGGDLNFYYFMATQFATSDRWFAPVMSRTAPNREYLIAATSQGDVYPIGTDSHDQSLLTAMTIFSEIGSRGHQLEDLRQYQQHRVLFPIPRRPAC